MWWQLQHLQHRPGRLSNGTLTPPNLRPLRRQDLQDCPKSRRYQGGYQCQDVGV